MKNIGLYLFLIMSSKTFAQVNLVPNPSFEDTVICPVGLFNLTNTQYWQNFRESPDYFNSCANSPHPSMGVPNNIRGNQLAKDGGAYIGFAAYRRVIPNFREHAGIQLTQPLSIGTKYFVKFYVTSADSVSGTCFCNKLGARFSTVSYSPSNPSPVDNFAHIQSDSMANENLNWIKISGSFIADSSYQYLILGNFFDDTHTDTLDCSFSSAINGIAYYYLDAVVVSNDSLFTDSVFASVHETIQINNISIYPNPAIDLLTVVSPNRISEIIIYNDIGKLVYQNKYFTNKAEIILKNISNGIYFLIEKENDNYLCKKFIISK